MAVILRSSLLLLSLLFLIFHPLRGDDTVASQQREMKIEKKFLRFPKHLYPTPKEDAAAANQRKVEFLIDGKIVTERPLSLADGTPDFYVPFDVSAIVGKTVVLKIDGLPVDSQALKNITQDDDDLDVTGIYQEPFRPQFHYTTRRGWLNDPNGLLFYKGQYHLFYQFNPLSLGLSAPFNWGHATSTDLVHWIEQPIAIAAGREGDIFSGSGVVDWNNTTGFKSGPHDPLVLAFFSHNPKPELMAQSLSYSTDAGKTFTKYANNPVLPSIAINNGDPKIFWYAPTKRWIMIITFPKENYGFFSSPDLKDWRIEQVVSLPFSECPDFFPLTVEGTSTQKWIMTTNPHTYFIGDFDGRVYKPDSKTALNLDWGSSFHSAQTFNEVPASDGRRIQVGWMQDVAFKYYRGTLFNQQLSFPTTLTLRQYPEGLRICREPVKEIALLHDKEHAWDNLELKPGENPLGELKGDLFEIRAVIEPGPAATVGLNIRGTPVVYSVKDKQLSVAEPAAPGDPIRDEKHPAGPTAPLDLENGKLTLHILVDRTSLEVFGNNGKVSLTTYFHPKDDATPLEIFARGGTAKIESLKVYDLHSMWPQVAK